MYDSVQNKLRKRMEKLKVEVIKERKEEMREKMKRRKHKHIVFPRHRT